MKTEESQNNYIHLNEKINNYLPKDTPKINDNNDKNKDSKVSQTKKKKKLINLNL